MSMITHAMKTLGVAAFAGWMLLACGPSAKNEQQYWDHNQAAVTEFKGRWSGFNALVDQEAADAKVAWDAAGKLTNEDEKAAKMKEANAKFEIIARMKEVDSKLDGVQSNIDKLNALKLTKSEDSTRQTAVEKARTLMSDVEVALATAQPADKPAALDVLGTQVSALIGDTSDTTYSQLTKKKSSSKKKK